MLANRPLELTRHQQDLLLRGLRFVKSSVALDMLEYSESVGTERKRKCEEISAVESLISGAKIVETVNV